MVKDQSIEAKAARESILYQVVSEILNAISIASAIFVLCAIIYLRKKRKKASNRVSLRLQSYVSITDMFFAAFQIMTVNSNPPGNWVCRVSPWGFVLTALLGCFFSATIALNLQIIFVHNYLSTRRFERYYVMIPLLLAFTLSTVPVLFNVLGYDEKEVSCWYKNGNTSDYVWQLATLHGWIVLSVLYCTCAVIAVINRLCKSGRPIMEMDQINSDYTKKREYKRQLIINKAVKRIVIYPIVPIVTFSFNIISNLIFFTTKSNNFGFQMMANIGTSSQGIFNAIAFCFDPAMKKIWKEIFDKLFNKKKANNNNSNNNSNNNFNSKKKASYHNNSNKNVNNDYDDFDDDDYDDDNENEINNANYHNSSINTEVITNDKTLNEDTENVDLDKIENVNNNYNDSINVISIMNVNDETNARTSEDYYKYDNILTLL